MNAHETQRRWNETRWMDSVCEHWEALFGSLRDEPSRAEAICSLGLKLIMEDGVNAFSQGRTRGLLPFFSLLLDCPEAARRLCSLGMRVVKRDVERNETTRSRVRAILWDILPSRQLMNGHSSRGHALIARRSSSPSRGGKKNGKVTRQTCKRPRPVKHGMLARRAAENRRRRLARSKANGAGPTAFPGGMGDRSANAA